MIPIRKVLPALAALVLASLMPPPALAQTPRAKVEQGVLEGTGSGSVTAFLGVPYAAPPVGKNRWKPPMPAKPWRGVRAAKTPGASCQQALTPNGFGPWTKEYVVTNEVSEDCLYLNVWTPADHTGEKLPVMVWIPGGAFSSGSGSVPIYNGSSLAARGIIVVTINYRVGVYGFMAHPDLAAESPQDASGNYGLLDQIAALQWVKANIAAFGGDPGRVTVAGQSAGAMSVHFLIASPLAKGLFVRAIAESGTGVGITADDRATAEQRGEALMKAAGVSNIAGMRQLTPAQLDAAVRKLPSGSARFPFEPIADGYVLPTVAGSDANLNDTPIMLGMTENEMTGLAPDFGKATPATFKAMTARSYGAEASKFDALYRASDDAAANRLVVDIARDRGLASIAMWARNRQAVSSKPVYAYLWTHAEPGPSAARYGAFHSSEIPYVFDTLDASPERPFGEIDRRLAEEMGSYWVNFVKTGDPNGPGLPAWPVYLQRDRQILQIGQQTFSRVILSQPKLALFEAFVEGGGALPLF